MTCYILGSLFKGHPRDRGKCPLNRGVSGMRLGWGLLIIKQQRQHKEVLFNLFVEFKRVQYIGLSEIIQFVKASIIVISVHLKISTLFVEC